MKLTRDLSNKLSTFSAILYYTYYTYLRQVPHTTLQSLAIMHNRESK